MLKLTYAITKMPVPQSLNELQSFGGIVNYVGKFNPGLAKVTALLHHSKQFWKMISFLICKNHN